MCVLRCKRQVPSDLCKKFIDVVEKSISKPLGRSPKVGRHLIRLCHQIKTHIDLSRHLPDAYHGFT